MPLGHSSYQPMQGKLLIEWLSALLLGNTKAVETETVNSIYLLLLSFELLLVFSFYSTLAMVRLLSSKAQGSK